MISLLKETSQRKRDKKHKEKLIDSDDDSDEIKSSK
jgi:hypothetical protein